MSRKGVGLAAFDKFRITSAQYASHGSHLRTSTATALENQLSVFRSLLQQFALTHAKDIRSNPNFRAEFARMCNAIGVDPLASSSIISVSSSAARAGNIWSQLLGTSVNDFYFELAVRVVEVCSATRSENGGLITVEEVCERIMRSRVEGAPDLTEDDIHRAVGTLKPLGSSYSAITVGSRVYIRSVSRELNTDQSSVLEAVQALGYVTVFLLITNLSWNRARAQTILDDLVMEGMLWLAQDTQEWEYWAPGLVFDPDGTVSPSSR